MKKLIIFLMVLVSIQTVNATADSWRTCDVNATCVLGDHVYNGTWQPYTERICTVNITYPNGTQAITDGSMDNNSLGTGFHNYSYTPTVEGFYAVEMYCTNGIDAGRIDRSFVAVIAGKNVWDYDNRTTFNWFDKFEGGDILAQPLLLLFAMSALFLSIAEWKNDRWLYLFSVIWPTMMFFYSITNNPFADFTTYRLDYLWLIGISILTVYILIRAGLGDWERVKVIRSKFNL